RRLADRAANSLRPIASQMRSHPAFVRHSALLSQAQINFAEDKSARFQDLPPTDQSNLPITACLAPASADLKNQPQPPVISALKTEFMACSLIWYPQRLCSRPLGRTAPAASTASHADRLQQTFIDGLSSAIQHRIHLRLPARLKDFEFPARLNDGIVGLSGPAAAAAAVRRCHVGQRAAPPAPMPASMAASAAVGRKGSPPLTSAAAVAAADLQDAAPWDEDDALAELGDA
uniref:CDT1 domain-containing protein n=1 Tax=Macrostomum lignano TaxID=282301 RepID=A0A1I8IDR8_9PLAT